jgi:hypothetical protein
MALIDIEEMLRQAGYFHSAAQAKNTMREEFNYAYNKAEATPVLDINKWISESTKLKGAFRSGREHFCKKSNYGRPTDNYKWLTACFDITDAKIVRL